MNSLVVPLRWSFTCHSEVRELTVLRFCIAARMTVDEETPLLSSPPAQSLGTQIKHESTETKPKSTRWIVYGCFIGKIHIGTSKSPLTYPGIFLAAADDSIVVSTWAAIASQFNRLSHGLWLVIAYNFGYCVSLPVVSTPPCKSGWH